MAGIIIDLPGTLTTVSMISPTALTNTGSAGVDVKDFIGNMLVTVNVSALTGTTPTSAVYIQSSATNNVSNATNILDPRTNTNVGTTAQANVSNVNLQTLSVDHRLLVGRYLFAIPAITGTNGAGTVSVTLTGQKKVN